jgi:hypothetical protein
MEVLVVEDRWHSVAVPILEYMREHARPMTMIPVWHIADATGIDPTDVAVELDSLIAAGYVVGPLRKTMSGGDPTSWFLESSSLGERGLREVGAWPSDDPYEALLDLLDRRIEATSDPAERSKLAALKSSVSDVGKQLIAGLLVEVAKGTIRF